MYAVSESVLLNYGSFLSIHFKILELQMESSYAIKILKSLKGIHESLRRNEMSFRLNFAKPCRKIIQFFTSLQVY